jgi:hypothetical protein
MWSISIFSRNDREQKQLEQKQLKGKADEPKNAKAQQVDEYYEERERATIVTKRRVIEYETHWRSWTKK